MKNFFKFIQDAVENVKEEAGKVLENAQEVAENLQKQLEETQKNEQNQQQTTAENNGGLEGMLKGFLGSLEGFANENNEQNANNSIQTLQATEEPITKIGHTFTIKGKDGEKTFHIATHAELLSEVDDGHYEHKKYFLTTNKDHFVLHTVMFYSGGVMLKGLSKVVVHKSQIANHITVEDNSLYKSNFEINIALKNKVPFETCWVGENPTTYDSDRLSIATNKDEKINDLQSLFLGRDLGGEYSNRLVFIGGDGTVIKTTDKPLFGGAGFVIYFERLDTEQTYRVIYKENNGSSCTVKVTHIPFDAFGDYKQMAMDYKEVSIPLSKPVHKNIYTDLQKPTTEEITGSFKMYANHFSARVTADVLGLIGGGLPDEISTKFIDEIYDPIVNQAYKIEAEVAEDRARREAEEKGISYVSSGNKHSKSDNNKEDDDKDDNKNSKSSGSSSKPLYDIKIKNDFDEPVTVYNKNRGGSYRIMPRTTNTIKCYEGDKLFHKETNKLLFVVDSSMDGKVQLISKL